MDARALLDQPWFRAPEPGSAAVLRSGVGALHGLRLLGLLRVFAPLTQAVTILFVTRELEVRVPWGPIYALLLAEVLLAAATWRRIRRMPHVSTLELVVQAHIDIALFTAMLYFTGGTTNPFAPLFLLPMAITASTQSSRWVWVTALTTAAAYVFLRFHHVPLFHPHGQTEVYDLHENGMVVNYMFTAALLSYFVIRTHAALHRRERALAEARDALLRNESVVAIGALAAGYAHELSTPLATIAVVAGELRRNHAHDPALAQDLHLIDQKVHEIKEIVSKLTSAGGQRRAEAATGARLDVFIQGIVERARMLHPGSEITTVLDSRDDAPQVVVEETLRQAITNLIDNAVQVSPASVEVRARWSGSHLHLLVSDRGPGISADVIGRLGREVRPERGTQGLGMGLLLAAATLERLGGSLALRNRAGGGAEAEITLPLQSIAMAG